MPVMGRVWWSLVWFGGSHFGRTLIWVAADVYAFYALTVVAALSAEEAGAVFLATMLFSAACDVTVGWMLDRGHAPSAGLLAVAATVAAAALAASLTATSSVLAVASALLFRLAYAVYDVPHNAMLKRLGVLGLSVVTVSAVRFLTGAAASFALAGLAAALVRERGAGLGVLALLVSATAGLTMVLYAPVVAGQAEAAPATAPARRPSGAALARSFLPLAVVALLAAVLGGLVTKALAFIAEGGGVGGIAWTGRALAILTLGRVVAAPLWALAAKGRPVLPLVAVAFGVVVLGGGLIAAAAQAQSTLEIGMGLVGAGFAGVTVYSWALLPDFSSAIGRASGRDPIHSAVAAFTALNKVALGLSGAAMAVLLAWSSAAGQALPLARAVGLVLVVGGLACMAGVSACFLRMRRRQREASPRLEEGVEEAG